MFHVSWGVLIQAYNPKRPFLLIKNASIYYHLENLYNKVTVIFSISETNKKKTGHQAKENSSPIENGKKEVLFLIFSPPNIYNPLPTPAS